VVKKKPDSEKIGLFTIQNNMQTYKHLITRNILDHHLFIY